MYTVVVENRVKRDLKQIPPNILEQLIKEFQVLGSSPRRRGAKKLSGTDGWRVRVGNYPILYFIDERNKLVVIYHIGHRKEVYR